MKTKEEKQAIENFIFSYRDAFNQLDIPKVLALYTQDGTHLPANRPTVKGQEQLKTFFGFLFKTFKINVEFSIVEIVLSGDYAFVELTSKGTVHVNATGENMPLDNKEIYILQNVNGSWKISKSIFNQTKL